MLQQYHLVIYKPKKSDNTLASLLCQFYLYFLLSKFIFQCRFCHSIDFINLPAKSAIFSFLDMQSTITSLGAHYNKLALQLAQQEYLQNQEAIQRDGELKYSTIHIDHHMSDYDFDDLEALQKEYSHCSPSDIAFKLAAITLDISSLVAERSLSALKQATIRPVIPVKMEERVKKEQFPWSVVWELNPESKSDKAHLRQILTSYYKTHFFEVSKVAAKWNITHTELSFWLKNGERHSKELQLKEEILNGSGDEMLGLSTFKKMAKRTMKSKNFRPNNKWCVSFVKKYKLQNLVELPVL